MIARVFISLPFDLLIREGDDLPTLEIAASDYHVRCYAPSHFTDRTKITDGGADAAISLSKASIAPFSDNLLIDNRRAAQVNVLILDFSKPEFDRSISDGKMSCRDPDRGFVFGIVNVILGKLRVYSRAFQIKELSAGNPWSVRYLTDEGQELEEEDGKIRGFSGAQFTIGAAPLTPDAISMVASPDSAEPYVWDQLLLDAYELLPDVGGAIAMAAAALETFIAWALDVLQEERELPEGLWKWMKTRNNDHTKEPSVAEKFDVLLRAFTGRSLKGEPELWKHFKQLRAARNSLVHEGVAIVEKSRVDDGKARALVIGADSIIKWCELLLPAARRRARTEAQGPFRRKLASQPEPVMGLQITANTENQEPIRVHRMDESTEPQSQT